MEKTNDKLLDLMLLLKLLERLKDGGKMAIHTAEEMPLSDYGPMKVIGIGKFCIGKAVNCKKFKNFINLKEY